MAKTILLLRHAKSAWGHAALADHDRPLNRRGERAAEAMADHIVRHTPRPDMILCSTATRTRQTLAPLVLRLAAPAPPIALEKSLYLASEDALLARLQAVPDHVGTVLMIGHNDGIWRLAETLGGQGLVELIVAETHTCYQGDRTHRHDWGAGCGTCDACRLRANGWARYRGA